MACLSACIFYKGAVIVIAILYTTYRKEDRKVLYGEEYFSKIVEHIKSVMFQRIILAIPQLCAIEKL